MRRPATCAECQRDARVLINPQRNPRSRNAHRGRYRRIKDHDLCARCFKKLMDAERAKQQRERALPVRPLTT